MKKKMLHILVLTVMIGLNIPAISSENDSLSIEYQFSSVIREGYLVVENTTLEEIPGEPLMPYRVARILLPQGTDLKDVTVTQGKSTIQKGFEIPWGQPSCTLSGEPQKVGRNETTYNSNEWYHKTVYDVVTIQSFRGFQILYVHLYPLQYRPQSGTVKFYDTLTVHVHLHNSSKKTLYRGLEDDKKDAAWMVDNPHVLETYTSVVPLIDTKEYIITTNSTMAPTFQQLANHKTNHLNSAGVYDVQWIYSTYTGYDNAEKIRNFIKDMYQNHSTKWCLLGGDVSVVPYRGFLCIHSVYSDYDMEADMYFGCLDGTFDADGDHVYGEPCDNVDWLEEVFIGRAPVETTAEAQMFVNKTIAYEQSDKPKVCQFHQARLKSNNIPDSRQIAWDCEYWTPSYYTKRLLFEEYGNVSKDDWRNAWAGNPLIIQHTGHGHPTDYQINMSVGDSVTWTTADVSTLTNTFKPVHMSMACHSGEFSVNDCLAEEYVKDDCGAVACMMNSSHGLYSTTDASMGSGDFLETMFRALFSDRKQHLGELLNQAKSYWASSAESNSLYRWCYYEINLLGDPETPVISRDLVIHLSGPQYPPEYSSPTYTVTVEMGKGNFDYYWYVNGGLIKYTLNSSSWTDSCTLQTVYKQFTISVYVYDRGTGSSATVSMIVYPGETPP